MSDMLPISSQIQRGGELFKEALLEAPIGVYPIVTKPLELDEPWGELTDFRLLAHMRPDPGSRVPVPSGISPYVRLYLQDKAESKALRTDIEYAPTPIVSDFFTAEKKVIRESVGPQFFVPRAFDFRSWVGQFSRQRQNANAIHIFGQLGDANLEGQPEAQITAKVLETGVNTLQNLGITGLQRIIAEAAEPDELHWSNVASPASGL